MFDLKDYMPLSDEELAARHGGAQPGSLTDSLVRLEMQRRVDMASREAAKAQIDAAAATIDTAYWTKVSAIATAVSVGILAASSVASLFISAYKG